MYISLPTHHSGRFFDAIRIPETNAYAINLLRAPPSVSKPPANKSTPEGGGEEEEGEEEEEETAAGAHCDGTRVNNSESVSNLPLILTPFLLHSDTLPVLERYQRWTKTVFISHLTTLIYLQVMSGTM